MAKKKDKALKSLEKDVAKLRKRNDKLAEAIEKTREDQAAAYKELRSLLEERLPAQEPGFCRAGRRTRTMATRNQRLPKRLRGGPRNWASTSPAQKAREQEDASSSKTWKPRPHERRAIGGHVPRRGEHVFGLPGGRRWCEGRPCLGSRRFAGCPWCRVVGGRH